MKRLVAALLLVSCVPLFGACGGARPRIRLHGWPDDVDLAESLEKMVDDSAWAKSHAPDLTLTRDGALTKVDDPGKALQPYRAHIKEALQPARDATPHKFRCDIARYRCLDDDGDVRTTFWLALKGPEGQRYIALERMEIAPLPK
jgi:hypothetical protein